MDHKTDPYEAVTCSLRRLESIADRSFDVADLEPELLNLRDFMRSLSDVDRRAADQALIDGFDARVEGVLEAIEFTQREFRSEKLRVALQDRARNATDYRRRDVARQVLAVYEPEWPDGEIYVTYRDETVSEPQQPNPPRRFFGRWHASRRRP